MIVKWQDYVKEHRAFSENHRNCLAWIDTMRKRLQVCGDLAGDRQDVEDRMQKLQVRNIVDFN